MKQNKKTKMDIVVSNAEPLSTIRVTISSDATPQDILDLIDALYDFYLELIVKESKESHDTQSRSIF